METISNLASESVNIGQGTYGKVYQVQVKSSNNETKAQKDKFLAVKTEPCDYGIPGSTIKEYTMLKNIHHRGVIKLKDFQLKDNHTRLILPLMDVHLSQLAEILDDEDIADNVFRITYILVKTLDFLHSCKIYHNDIKPANIMIKEKDGQLHAFFIDFGLSTWGPYKPDCTIVTATHRPPELFFTETCLIDDNQFGKIDVWSLGCSLYEFVTRGKFANWSTKTNHGILKSVFGKTGLDDAFIKDYPKCNYKTCDSQVKKLIMKANKSLDRDFADLVSKMLNVNPKLRPSARELLEHPFLATIAKTDTTEYNGYFSVEYVEPPPKEPRFRYDRLSVFRFLKRLAESAGSMYIISVSAMHLLDRFMGVDLDNYYSYCYVIEVAVCCFWICCNTFQTVQITAGDMRAICSDLGFDIEYKTIVKLQRKILKTLHFDVYRISLYESMIEHKLYDEHDANITKRCFKILCSWDLMSLPISDKLDYIYNQK